MTYKKKFKKTAYTKLPKAAIEALWNNGIYGKWVWVPTPGSQALNSGKTSVILYELFEIANDKYQETRGFSFLKEVGGVSEMASSFGCSAGLASKLRKKANNKWKAYYQRERVRKSGFSKKEEDVYFKFREELMDWYDTFELADYQNAIASKIIEIVENYGDDDLDNQRNLEISELAIDSLVDVRAIKERRRGKK